MGKIDELYVELGIDAKGAGTTLGDLMGKMAGMRLTTLGAIDGLMRFGNFWKDSTLFTENAAVAFTNFNSITGLGIDKLQRWQIAGRQVNVTNDQVAGSMGRLQQKLMDVQIYGRGLEPFAMLGVTPTGRDDVYTMMEKLSVAARRLPPAVFTKFAAEMGIDPNMIRLLRMTPAERRAAQVAGGLGAEDIKSAMAFNEQFNALKTQWDQFKYFLGTSVFPTLTDFFGHLNQITNANSSFLDRIKGGVGVAGNMLSFLGPLNVDRIYGVGQKVVSYAGDIKVAITSDQSQVAKDTAAEVNRTIAIAEQQRTLNEKYDTSPAAFKDR